MPYVNYNSSPLVYLTSLSWTICINFTIFVPILIRYNHSICMCGLHSDASARCEFFLLAISYLSTILDLSRCLFYISFMRRAQKCVSLSNVTPSTKHHCLLLFVSLVDWVLKSFIPTTYCFGIVRYGKLWIAVSRQTWKTLFWKRVVQHELLMRLLLGETWQFLRISFCLGVPGIYKSRQWVVAKKCCQRVVYYM